MKTTVAFKGGIPEKYDRYLGPFLFEPYALDIVSRLQDKEYNDILEVACGTGRVTAHLAKDVKHHTITATDLNPDMIEVAMKRVHNDSVKWLQADATELPFDDNSFDLVTLQFGIMFFPDKLKALAEFYRVLKPGGKLLYNTWDKSENVPAIYEGRKVIESYFKNGPPAFYYVPFSMYDEKELSEITTSAGFKNVKVELVKKEAVSSSAEELTIGIVEGNPIYLEILEMDPKLVEPIMEQVKNALVKRFGDNPLKDNLRAWVVEGIK